MRLQCDVQVSDHQACVRKPGKPAFTQVSVGRKPGYHGKDDPIYVMLCTAQNRNGSKYVIRKNLKQIFGKFVKDGKATVRFTNPPHDLAFSKASPACLQTFLRVVKLVAEGKELPSQQALSALAPVSSKQVERPVASMVVSKPSEYPMTFPASLVTLTVNGCSLRRVSPRVCSLTKLTTLDLSSNSLATLPDAFSQLACLGCLSLRHNKMADFPAVLCASPVSQSLRVLDLNHNQLTRLPPCVKKLTCVQQLDVSHNALRFLPDAVGHMASLCRLSASNNQIACLPGSLLLHRWEHVDLCNNPYSTGTFSSLVNWNGESPELAVFFQPPSLAEWAARAVVKHRIHYTPYDLDWYSRGYLERALYCMCGAPCFETRLSVTKWQPIRAVQSYGGEMPFRVHMCSLRCFKIYRKRSN